jgi:hypothetical protein
MDAHLFLVALVLGAGALALWVDVRFPGLAPRGLTGKFVAVLAAPALLGLLPVSPTMLSVLGLLLPTLTATFLAALWMLRALAQR